MFEITAEKYTMGCLPAGLPDLYTEYAKRAQVVDEFDLQGTEGEVCFLSVSRGGASPFLVVAQRYSPASGGFNPGALIVPETDLLFLGAGTRLLCYDLKLIRRKWEDTADTGFWNWARFGDVVLMSAELEFAAWSYRGEKLWSTFVEPPWTYAVCGTTINLDVMGQRSEFSLNRGPDHPQTHSVFDVLNRTPGNIIFRTADEVDAYIRDERDSWE